MTQPTMRISLTIHSRSPNIEYLYLMKKLRDIIKTKTEYFCLKDKPRSSSNKP